MKIFDMMYDHIDSQNALISVFDVDEGEYIYENAPYAEISDVVDEWIICSWDIDDDGICFNVDYDR